MGRLRPGLGVLAETQSDGQARLRGMGGPSWSPVTCSISVSTSIMHKGCDSPPRSAVFLLLTEWIVVLGSPTM